MVSNQKNTISCFDENFKKAIDALAGYQKLKAETMIEIEGKRQQAKASIEEMRLKIFEEKQSVITFVSDLKTDTRKELIGYLKKSLPDIHGVLMDNKVPDAIASEWLGKVCSVLVDDIRSTLAMLTFEALDLEKELYKSIAENYGNKFDSILDSFEKKMQEQLTCVSLDETVEETTSE